MFGMIHRPTKTAQTTANRIHGAGHISTAHAAQNRSRSGVLRPATSLQRALMPVRKSRGTSSLLFRFAFTGLWLRRQKLSPPTFRHTSGSSSRTQGRYPDVRRQSMERANSGGVVVLGMRAARA
jgi:hypothetical protein